MADQNRAEQNTALVTGASAGLGRAVARELVHRGWRVIGTARRADRLHEVAGIVALPGDVADPNHRAEIAATVRELGRLDLLMNNASRLGPSPLPKLADLDPAELVLYRGNECRCATGAHTGSTAVAARVARRRAQRQLRRGRRRLRRVGRLRFVEGRARPAFRGARRRGTGPAGVRGRPR